MSQNSRQPESGTTIPPEWWTELESLEKRIPWTKLRKTFADAVGASFDSWIGSAQAHHDEQRRFAVGRVDEGACIVRLFAAIGALGPQVDVLDVGSGNGGVSFAFANCRRARVRAVDIVVNRQLHNLRRELGLPVDAIAADGGRLPFHDESFDIVLLCDVFEHLARPRDVAREAMRVLRPGGVCLVTTPARFLYLFRRDPHYGIRGLLLLPNPVQRFVVNRLFRRRVQGHDGRSYPAYDVEHTYWVDREVARQFPEPKQVEVLYERAFAPPGRFAAVWLRAPRLFVEHFRHALRRFQFAHLLIYKEKRPMHVRANDPLS